MKYEGIICKSRTYDFSALLTVLGVVLANFERVSVWFGDYSGVAFIAVSAIVALLRQKTTGAVGDK